MGKRLASGKEECYINNKEGKDEKDLRLDSRLGYRRRGPDITALLKGRRRERQARRPSAKATPLNAQASLEFGGGGQGPLGCVFQRASQRVSSTTGE